MIRFQSNSIIMKFTAANDVGFWSYNGNIHPHLYRINYENTFENPEIIFSYHETNFKQFLENKDNLISVFPKESFKYERLSLDVINVDNRNNARISNEVLEDN